MAKMENLSQALEQSPVRLEPLAEKHIEPLRAACAEDQEIWEIYPVNMLGDDFDKAMQAFHNMTSWVPFAVINMETENVVGMTNYINPDQHGVVEIGGTYIAPSVRGVGFNHVMKTLLLDHAFANGFTKVEFRVDGRNKRSQAAVLKLGAKHEGTLRKNRTTWTGYQRDTCVFGLAQRRMERLNMTDDVNGWVSSADAWIASIGEEGDWARKTFLDAAMIERAKARKGRFLDIGCGEGRFVRRLQELGMNGVGIDPVEKLIETARERDPEGDYRIGVGEKLEFDDASFDLTVSYLSLIDIEDFRAAIREMARVTKPGGTILIANLSGHVTAGKWKRDLRGAGKRFELDNYHEERATREQWRGIDILNWHRPLSAYFEAFLGNGLTLKHFAESTPPDQDDPKSDRYTRVPAFVVMEWEKPA